MLENACGYLVSPRRVTCAGGVLAALAVAIVSLVICHHIQSSLAFVTLGCVVLGGFVERERVSPELSIDGLYSNKSKDEWQRRIRR